MKYKDVVVGQQYELRTNLRFGQNGPFYDNPNLNNCLVWAPNYSNIRESDSIRVYSGQILVCVRKVNGETRYELVISPVDELGGSRGRRVKEHFQGVQVSIRNHGVIKPHGSPLPQLTNREHRLEQMKAKVKATQEEREDLGQRLEELTDNLVQLKHNLEMLEKYETDEEELKDAVAQALARGATPEAIMKIMKEKQSLLGNVN